MLRWLIKLYLRGAVSAAALRLAIHVKGCQKRQCKYVDLSNCDETSFCQVGNALFVDEFEIQEILGRYER
jgi:hypothetical protein